jgi:CheY-like chemotaxis protein
MNDDAPSSVRHVVLYVEDNMTNLRLVERIFDRRPDLELMTATSGLTGLEMARDHQPAVILLDVHLPDVTGDKVLIRLRDDSLTRTIPVVMLSADASEPQIQRLLNYGAAAYLTKPLDIRNLLETVDKFIRTEAISRRGR